MMLLTSSINVWIYASKKLPAWIKLKQGFFQGDIAVIGIYFSVREGGGGGIPPELFNKNILFNSISED